MRMVLDACVIFPTVMREVLIGAAEAGLYTPLWSERIIGEWVRAAGRLGDGASGIARAEAAVMQDAFPAAMIAATGPDCSGALPDPGDDHVLATALAGAAAGIVTRNIKDFPLRVLGAHGLIRSGPDDFLMALRREAPDALGVVLTRVHGRAEAISGRDQDMRRLLKRAGLPRLGKAHTLGM